MSSQLSLPSSSHTSRTRSAVRAATVHLLLSAAVAAGVALLVFGLWYPDPLRQLAGGDELFWLIVKVDLVCGPLLTLVVFNPAKRRSELCRDIATVAAVQLLALAYGLHSLAYARPVALVHEVDRFRVVSYADIEESDVPNVPAWAQPWSFSGPRTMGVRPAANSDEKWARIGASLQGVEASQRPSSWQDYGLSVPQVLRRAQGLSALRAKHPQQIEVLGQAVRKALANHQANEATDGESLVWLPLVSRRVMDWVVLLDPVTARIRGYVHLDGF